MEGRMKKIELTEATEALAEYVKHLDDGLIITFRGMSLAALVPLDNVDYETVALSTDPGFIEILEKSRAQLKKEGGISHEEMRREFETQ
jgi:hypothetical protein